MVRNESISYMRQFLSCFLLLFAFTTFAEKIKLSTVYIDVPERATRDNKTSISMDGVSTYAFNRLRADSTAYIYYYSFKYDKALYEFRETCKADIWEWLENSYQPSWHQKKEFRNYKIKAFKSLNNSLLKGKLQQFRIEYLEGLRKLTLIYKLDETRQFMASVKSAFPPEDFMDTQDTLIKMLESVEQKIPKIRPHGMFEQKGEIAEHVKHHIVRLPFALSNDFNNPVVEVTDDGETIIAFAHADGSEVIRLDQNFKIIATFHYDRLIHDIVAIKNGFFAASSDQYNLLRYNRYPALYLTKHKKNGDLIFTQSFFKRDKLTFPGWQTFDFYSRDNVCLEIADSIGIVYCNAEKKMGFSKVIQQGAYKTFSVQTGFLKKGKKDLWHVSHCFAQKSTQHRNDAYLFSIGDFDPRGITLSKVNLTTHKDSLDTTSFWHKVLLPINGILGDNYVYDSHISKPIVWKNKVFIALETEQDARTDMDKNLRSANRGNNDIFVISCTLDGEEFEVQQITKTKHIEEINPKLIAFEDKMLLLFSEVQFDRNGFVEEIREKYIYMDERLLRESLPEDFNSYYNNERSKNWNMPDSGINRDGSEFIKTKDGRALWIRLMRNTQQLEVIEIKG
ncbi:MAG: hypothetical protein WDZ35_02075 [Crocinitomicaceae bacterium]